MLFWYNFMITTKIEREVEGIYLQIIFLSYKINVVSLGVFFQIDCLNSIDILWKLLLLCCFRETEIHGDSGQ